LRIPDPGTRAAGRVTASCARTTSRWTSRPHDVALDLAPGDGALAAERSAWSTSASRCASRRGCWGGDGVTVQLSRGEARGLGLEAGQTVHVRAPLDEALERVG
jgi:hypothetical protein